nr:MAG TPA: hypothetical protein [Bacteriophage sp.]
MYGLGNSYNTINIKILFLKPRIITRVITYRITIDIKNCMIIISTRRYTNKKRGLMPSRLFYRNRVTKQSLLSIFDIIIHFKVLQ